MSDKVKLGELYFDYQVGDEPISEIDNDEFRQIKSDIEEINRKYCLGHIMQGEIITLTYYLYQKNYKKCDALAEYYARHPQVDVYPCDDMVDAIEYGKDYIQKSLDNMILPKDFRNRFNSEMIVLSTGKLPNALKPNDLKEK